MTRSEALAEARRRWGPRAEVWKGLYGYCVGVKSTWPAVYKMEGRGLGWKSAFADADRREEKRKAAAPVEV